MKYLVPFLICYLFGSSVFKADPVYGKDTNDQTKIDVVAKTPPEFSSSDFIRLRDEVVDLADRMAEVYLGHLRAPAARSFDQTAEKMHLNLASRDWNPRSYLLVDSKIGGLYTSLLHFYWTEGLAVGGVNEIVREASVTRAENERNLVIHQISEYFWSRLSSWGLPIPEDLKLRDYFLKVWTQSSITAARADLIKYPSVFNLLRSYQAKQIAELRKTWQSDLARIGENAILDKLLAKLSSEAISIEEYFSGLDQATTRLKDLQLEASEMQRFNQALHISFLQVFDLNNLNLKAPPRPLFVGRRSWHGGEVSFLRNFQHHLLQSKKLKDLIDYALSQQLRVHTQVESMHLFSDADGKAVIEKHLEFRAGAQQASIKFRYQDESQVPALVQRYFEVETDTVPEEAPLAEPIREPLRLEVAKVNYRNQIMVSDLYLNLEKQILEIKKLIPEDDAPISYANWLKNIVGLSRASLKILSQLDFNILDGAEYALLSFLLRRELSALSNRYLKVYHRDHGENLEIVEDVRALDPDLIPYILLKKGGLPLIEKLILLSRPSLGVLQSWKKYRSALGSQKEDQFLTFAKSLRALNEFFPPELSEKISQPIALTAIAKKYVSKAAALNAAQTNYLMAKYKTTDISAIIRSIHGCPAVVEKIAEAGEPAVPAEEVQVTASPAIQEPTGEAQMEAN